MDTRPSVFSADNRIEAAVYPHDVFVCTDAGDTQLHSGSTQLPPDALAVLVMLDGKKTVGDLEQKLSHITPQTVRDLLRSLLGARLVRAATMAELGELGDVELDIGAFLAAAGGAGEAPAGVQASAGREADTGAPRLARDGYYVSIARQALQARPTSQGPLRALVIEDDPDMATLVRRLLEKAQLEVETAATREEVMAGLRSARIPDIIVLDVVLPGMNGFDLLKRLKLHPVLKKIPVVMLTADAERESVVRGLAAGADGYITKPFDPAALLAGVKAVLGL